MIFFFFVSFFDLHTYVRLVRSTYAVYPNRCEFALTPATVSCHSLAIVLSNVTRSYDGHNSLRKYLQLAISTRLKNSVIPTKMNEGIEKYLVLVLILWSKEPGPRVMRVLWVCLSSCLV